MSGTRTKTGCYTCRLRRKKCDEQKPACLSCCSRGIPCYGYGHKPAWMLGKKNWQEISECDEARNIRASAEMNYKHRRRRINKMPSSDVGFAEDDSSTNGAEALLQRPTLDRIWADSNSLIPSCNFIPDGGLVLTFLDLIFPLQYGFYELHRHSERRWLFEAIVDSEAFYHVTSSLCYSFLSGLRKGSTSGLCEMTPEVRRSQVSAIQSLQPRIDDLGNGACQKESFLRKSIEALSVVLHLMSLEIFGTLEGAWVVHLRAARTLVGMIEMSLTATVENGSVESVPESQRRGFDFFITSFAWVDIMANATYGRELYNPRAVDYLQMLRNGSIDTRSIMGCQSATMLAIGEIAALECGTPDFADISVSREKSQRAFKLQSELKEQVKDVELMSSHLTRPGLEADSALVTTIHAFGALTYLHSAVSGPYPHAEEIKKNVTRCLEALEGLPARLFIRVCWPFTIAGSMADEEQHERFRALVARTEKSGNVLGFTWKGLLVMEECWRLRRACPGAWCWRSTMKQMGVKILLI